MWADRILHTAIADQAVGYGLVTRADLERISAGWRSWSEAPEGWFILHAEILCRRWRAARTIITMRFRWKGYPAWCTASR
jgi:hypothetical protein